MQLLKSFLFFSILFTVLVTFLISCQSSSEKATANFAKKFEGDWKLIYLKGKHGVADSVVKKFPVTLNVEDTAFLFRQATNFAGTTYRNWIYEDLILLLPYSNAERKEDTLRFRLLQLTEKELILERKDSSNVEFDTLYFEKY